MPNKPGGTPTRTYVVVEELQFADTDETYFVEVHRVVARNSPNAKRKAFRELRERDPGRDAATTLMAIPEGMWKPTPVRARLREQIAVDIGEPAA